MIRKILNWLDEHEDFILMIFAFGVTICLAIGLMIMSFVI